MPVSLHIYFSCLPFPSCPFQCWGSLRFYLPENGSLNPVRQVLGPVSQMVRCRKHSTFTFSFFSIPWSSHTPIVESRDRGRLAWNHRGWCEDKQCQGMTTESGNRRWLRLERVSVEGTSIFSTLCQISTVSPHPILISVQETVGILG